MCQTQPDGRIAGCVPVFDEEGKAELCTRQCFVVLWYMAEQGFRPDDIGLENRCFDSTDSWKRLLSRLGLDATREPELKSIKKAVNGTVRGCVFEHMQRIMRWACAYRLTQEVRTVVSGLEKVEYGTVPVRRTIRAWPGLPERLEDNEHNPVLPPWEAQGCWFWHPVFGGAHWEGDRAPAKNEAELEHCLKDTSRFRFGPDCKPGYFPPTSPLSAGCRPA